MNRLYLATLNTIRGFSAAAKTEAALRQEIALLAIALPLGIAIAPGPAWYVAMIGSLLAIMAVELLNTAVEKLADHVTPHWNEDIGRIKDFGSAAVFCALTMAGLVWITAAAVRFGLV